MLLGTAGYKAVTRGTRNARIRGWMVYERDSEEITLAKKREVDYASMQPSNVFFKFTPART